MTRLDVTGASVCGCVQWCCSHEFFKVFSQMLRGCNRSQCGCAWKHCPSHVRFDLCPFHATFTSVARVGSCNPNSLRWCLNERGWVEETTRPWVPCRAWSEEAIHVQMKKPGSD